MKTNISKFPFLYFASGLLAGAFIVILLAFKEINIKTVNNTQNDSPRYTWQPPKLPDHLEFAGEVVPLYRWEIREETDRH